MSEFNSRTMNLCKVRNRTMLSGFPGRDRAGGLPLPRRKRSTSADARATCGIPLSCNAEPCHRQVNLEGF